MLLLAQLGDSEGYMLMDRESDGEILSLDDMIARLGSDAISETSANLDDTQPILTVSAEEALPTPEFLEELEQSRLALQNLQHHLSQGRTSEQKSQALEEVETQLVQISALERRTRYAITAAKYPDHRCMEHEGYHFWVDRQGYIFHELGTELYPSKDEGGAYAFVPEHNASGEAAEPLTKRQRLGISLLASASDMAPIPAIFFCIASMTFRLPVEPRDLLIPFVVGSTAGLQIFATLLFAHNYYPKFQSERDVENLGERVLFPWTRLVFAAAEAVGHLGSFIAAHTPGRAHDDHEKPKNSDGIGF